MSEMLEFSGGKVSASKVPRWDLIPRQALLRLIERFELGEQRHKEKAWNALSKNQECLTDLEWITTRCIHCIDHAYKLIEKLHKGLPLNDDDDAGAIAWAGIFLCEAISAIQKQREESNLALETQK